MTTIEAGGIATLKTVLQGLGARKVLVLLGVKRGVAGPVLEALGDLDHEVFDEVVRHVPEKVVAAARERLDALGANVVVSVGGGSATGLAKALRLEREVGFVAVPTTYAGSEMTNIYGITRDRTKTTGRDDRVRPDVIVHEPTLTQAMPRKLTVTSLMNALAHPISALSTKSLEGDDRIAALDTVTSLVRAIERLVEAPTDRAARREALSGASGAGRALSVGKMGVHHKLAHLLGGRFDLDHAGLHALLLPHSIQQLRAAAPDLVETLCEYAAVPDLEGWLFDRLVRVGAATRLGALEEQVTLPAVEELLGSSPDLPRRPLLDAVHGRRPSAATRRETWEGLQEPVATWGPPLAKARRAVLALHGRGGSAEGILQNVREIIGDAPGVAIVAPQAPGRSWYGGPYGAPLADLEPDLGAALGLASTMLQYLIGEVGPGRVALLGFSQGACLACEVFARHEGPVAALVAFSGARIGPLDGHAAPVRRSGTPVLLGVADRDPWVKRGDVVATAEALEAAGCRVTVFPEAGDRHALHHGHRVAARDILTGQSVTAPAGGHGAMHEAELLPGALPTSQNSPRHAPYGLYPEQINATGFAVARHRNVRSWLYRVRPSAQHSAFEALEHATFQDDWQTASPEVNLAGWDPLPIPDGATDFVDGLAAIGGVGSPALRRGYQVSVYAANRSMVDRAFYSADGEMLLVPQEGALTLLTTTGVLTVTPGQIAILPRGVRFTVLLQSGAARGYLAEAFGRTFELPERGVLGPNGVTEARHFRAPTPWYEDRLAPGYRITAKLGGRLVEARQDHSPYDVVAWHGNYTAYAYDLSRFVPFSTARVDHADPSIYTVLSAPLDEPGVSTLDFVVFPPRWDPTEHTFRPPFFHRNATMEMNGIIQDPSLGAGDPFRPGSLFITPPMTPHGILARGVERFLALSDEHADRPKPPSRESLWFQFESAMPLQLTTWARHASTRRADWHDVWGTYRTHFDATRKDW